jgi:hypothetical protein
VKKIVKKVIRFFIAITEYAMQAKTWVGESLMLSHNLIGIVPVRIVTTNNQEKCGRNFSHEGGVFKEIKCRKSNKIGKFYLELHSFFDSNWKMQPAVRIMQNWVKMMRDRIKPSYQYTYWSNLFLHCN